METILRPGDRLDLSLVRPGTRQLLRVPIDGQVDLYDPTEVDDRRSIRGVVIVGRAHHPCLALVGGIHGDEYDGILALQEVARAWSPDRLAGSLIVIPVANPFAFAAAQRRTPDDDRDLNRVFPGKPDGTLSERLAYRLGHEVLQAADLVFTLHGATVDGMLAPWIEFLNEPGLIGRTAYAAARAAGFPDLVGLPKSLPGRLLTGLARLGKPVIEGEVGGRGVTQPKNVAYYRERVDAVASHLGVRDDPVRTDVAQTAPRVWALRDVKAGVAGIFQREVELRQEVSAGERLGQVVDAMGEVAGEIRAPVAAVVASCREHAGVRADDAVFTLWLPEDVRVDGVAMAAEGS